MEKCGPTDIFPRFHVLIFLICNSSKDKKKKYDLRKMSSAVLTKGPGPLFDVMSEKIITLRKTHRDFRMDLGKKLSC